MLRLFYKLTHVLIFTPVFILSACGGSGTVPSVSSTSPVDSAAGVARNTTVTAMFDKDVFAATVDNASFTLTNGDSVGGQITFDGATNIATFTPTNDLAKLTSYTATLTTGVTDLSGNALENNYSWSFTTDDVSWGSAELIETDNVGDANHPKVTFDGSGNAIAVWRQKGDSYLKHDLWANRYVAGAGWGTAELIEDSGEFIGIPKIASDDLGNAIVVWGQTRGGFTGDIGSNRYVAGVGWGNE